MSSHKKKEHTLNKTKKNHKTHEKGELSRNLIDMSSLQPQLPEQPSLVDSVADVVADVVAAIVPDVAAAPTATATKYKKTKQKATINENDDDIENNEFRKKDSTAADTTELLNTLDTKIEKLSRNYNENETPLQREKRQYDYLKENPNATAHGEYETYPTLNDPNFAVKLAKRKEFFHTRYDGTIYGVKQRSDTLCNLKEFELMPNQLFVKNFMSLNTPYNSLLLYFGLGTGKTCAAIGVAEEMRSYMKQIGLKHKIMVIASPNVQDNFRVQLFDKNKLKRVNDLAEDSLWNIESCIGNSLLKEINPMNLKGLTREKVISQIESIINTNYLFMGYGQLFNYIQDAILNGLNMIQSKREREQQEIRNIRRHFNNQLIIIDEVHNIHLNEENAQNKRVANYLMKISKYANNLRFVLLSATPMYNSYKEIIWLTNLMNINDGRAAIDVADVFDKVGNFVQPSDPNSGKEGGKELLERKLTGYVSYIRGENPYLFPFRVYPDKFAEHNTFETKRYPELQMNKKRITEPLKYIKVYLNSIGEYQKQVYDYILHSLKKRLSKGAGGENTFEKMTSFGYVILQIPLQALNIVFPNPQMDKLIKEYKSQKSAVAAEVATETDSAEIIFDEDLTPAEEYNEDALISGASPLPQEIEYSKEELNSFGTVGFRQIMDYEDKKKPYPQALNFEYKKNVAATYGRIFDEKNISKYSDKISRICKCVKNSTGIVLIYSQYIYCGVLPIALALEEMGFSRHSSNPNFKNLFKPQQKHKIPTVDALTMRHRSEVVEDGDDYFPAKYIMITGDKAFSPSNAEDIKYATNIDNKDGSRVKVILISKAGSEGLDFKFIRQIHVLEPWYNMNRLEQIIGRGVRSLSHCALPFEERNVEIYLHATYINEERGEHATKNKHTGTGTEETADLYIYRLAEKKALKIGQITRILKEVSVDCILNIEQTNFTVIKMQESAENKKVKIRLSSTPDSLIKFKVGDQPMTEMCDYMATCEYKCNGNLAVIKKETDTIKETYDIDYIKINYQQIVDKIRKLFKEQTFYKRAILINSINLIKYYPIEQIYYALTYLIENKHEYLVDKYGRLGNLINKDEYYIFQPIEITDTEASIYERTTPIDYKRPSIGFETVKKFGNMKTNTMTADMQTQTTTPTTQSAIFNEDTFSLKKDKTDNYAEKNISNKTPQTIFNNIQENCGTVLDEKKATIKSGEKDWYKHANLVRDHLILTHSVPLPLFKKYIIYHALDMMPYSEKVVILNYITSHKTGEFRIPKQEAHRYNKTLTENILGYYAERLIYDEKTKTTAFILNENDSWIQIFELEYADNNYKWEIMQKIDIKKISKQIENKLKIDNSDIAHLVGFVNLFKNSGTVFRVKEMINNRNNSGAVCGNSTVKADSIKIINKLLDNKIYNNNDTIQLTGICVIIEILMRHFTEIKKDGKKYFFNGEETTMNGISKKFFMP